MTRSYEELEAQVNLLSSERKYAEAAALLETAAVEFPQHIGSINLDLAFLHMQLGSVDKGAQRIKEALDMGIWYPKQFFKPYLKSKEFEEIIPAWDRLETEGTSKGAPEWQIVLPNNYDESRAYPLFVAIHGWGEDLKLFSKFWSSPLIREQYILAMPQSSQVMGSFHYCWNDSEKTHAEIKRLYEHVCDTYKVDEARTIVGGFSQGATVALDIALNYAYMPLKGIIALNPSKPELFNEQVLLRAKQNNIRLCIITGDKDGDYQEQLEMKAEFERLKMHYLMSIKENWGHWFPSDLGERIDISIEFISN